MLWVLAESGCCIRPAGDSVVKIQVADDASAGADFVFLTYGIKCCSTICDTISLASFPVLGYNVDKAIIRIRNIFLNVTSK